MAKLTPKKEPAQKQLDAREKRFVAEYVIDLNPERAAIEAGYSISMAKSKAYQWVSGGKVKPHVYAAIQKAQKKAEIRAEITQDDVIKGLHAEATNTAEGSSASARVSAWNLLGKHLGMFKEKIEHSGTVTLETLVQASVPKDG